MSNTTKTNTTKKKKIKAFCIWQPKFKTDIVYIKTTRVSETEDTYIYFCGDDSHPNLYRIPAPNFFNYEIGNNSSALCFVVPMKDLIDMGELPSEYIAKREKELEKLRNHNTGVYY